MTAGPDLRPAYLAHREAIEAAISAVAQVYDLRARDLKAGRRRRSVAWPRAVAMAVTRTVTSASYPEIAEAFGGRHHTTVISAVKRVSRRSQEDLAVRAEVSRAEEAARSEIERLSPPPAAIDPAIAGAPPTSATSGSLPDLRELRHTRSCQRSLLLGMVRPRNFAGRTYGNFGGRRS